MADVEPGTAAVKDHRVAPRGVLPRNTQMWLMVGLAVTIIGIIVFVGHPEPVSRPGPVERIERPSQPPRCHVNCV